MATIDEAFARLDDARARHGLAPMPAGLPEDRVLELLAEAGVHPHDHLVAWYTHYGSPEHERLVPGVFVCDLEAETDIYLDLLESAEDIRHLPVDYSQAVDWFPIGKEFGRVVMWARECEGEPALAHHDELANLSPIPTGERLTLPELLTTWATRLDLGCYTGSDDGTIPWLEFRLAADGSFEDVVTDDVRRRAGL